MTVRRILPILITLLALPSQATAQDDGVFVDPSSPSGKEYQIPLESARRQADPNRKSGRVAPGERSAPLFGDGIEPDQPAPGAAAGGGPGSTGQGGERGDGLGKSKASPKVRAPDSPDVPAEVQEAVRAARSAPAPAGGGLGTALIVGGGLAVALLTGAGVALAARRGRADAAT